MPRLVDTHSHLHFPPFDENREAVLEHMRQEDIWAITVGTSVLTSQRGIALAEKEKDVWATVGYHPEHLTSSYFDEKEGQPEKYDIKKIAELARSSKKVVAIGETGLDFYRIDNDRDREEAQKLQEQAFLEHLTLARELDLPVVIHCRNAFGRLAELVPQQTRGVVHCFTGSWDEAKPLIDLGLHLSFTGIITFPPKKTDDPEHHVHRVIERMPLERLMIETDAPWLAPEPHRGKQNEPAFVKFVAEKIGELRDMKFDDVAMTITQNARKFFGI